MHVFTKVLDRLMADHRDASARFNAATDTMKRQLYRGKMIGLGRAIHLLKTERDRKMDDLAELVRKA